MFRVICGHDADCGGHLWAVDHASNTGDPDAILDTFPETPPMTVPHRITDNESERLLVEATDALHCNCLHLSCFRQPNKNCVLPFPRCMGMAM